MWKMWLSYSKCDKIKKPNDDFTLRTKECKECRESYENLRYYVLQKEGDAMSWTEDIALSIKYIESNLTQELTLDEIARKINLSPFYFQKGFSILCGITVSEYIRNRRLSLAGRDLQIDGAKVIDVAMKYCYDSPDSFTKAFTRFHGITPSQAKAGEGEIRNYLPLKIQISMKGGFEMECKIVRKPAFTVIGSAKIIKHEDGYKECPKFWDEHYKNGNGRYVNGTYGICLSQSEQEGCFKYMIADDYVPAKELPEEFKTEVIPENTWAVFPCKGAMPEALQKVNTQIFKEWLPGNSDYEIAGAYNIEYYANPCDYPKGTQDENYYSEIWMPVKSKK